MAYFPVIFGPLEPQVAGGPKVTTRKGSEETPQVIDKRLSKRYNYMTRMKKKWHHKEVLEGMYLDQSLSMRQIAEILGTTAPTIRYWMQKFRIESRDHDIGDLNRGKELSDKEKNLLSEISLSAR